MLLLMLAKDFPFEFFQMSELSSKTLIMRPPVGLVKVGQNTGVVLLMSGNSEKNQKTRL